MSIDEVWEGSRGERSEGSMEDVNEANGGKRFQANLGPVGTVGCWSDGYHRLVV